MNSLDINHPVSISILCLASFIYYRLVFAKISIDTLCPTRLGLWQESLQRCICALPLLGLLGTIIGLLSAFVAMSQGQTVSGENQLTSAISNALFTTQLGLLFAVPAWLLHASVNSDLRKRQAEKDSQYAI